MRHQPEVVVGSFALHRAERQRRERARRAGRVVGMFFLWTSGVHAGIVAADPQFYRPFADSSFLPFVRDGWREVVMALPVLWGLLLMAGEAALGGLLLLGGRAAKAGWAGVIGFHVLLMLFGFGFWLWSVPALAILVPLAVRDWPGLSPRPSAGSLSPPRGPAPPSPAAPRDRRSSLPSPTASRRAAAAPRGTSPR